MDWIKGRKVSTKKAVIVLVIVWQLTTLIFNSL